VKLEHALATALFSIVLALMLVPQAYAFSVDIEAEVGQDIDIVIKIEHLDFHNYSLFKVNETKVVSNVKACFEKSFEDQNLTATVSVKPLEFDEETFSTTIRARISGSDVVYVSTDPDSLNRTFEVETAWRRFQLNLTDELSINMTERFGYWLQNWNRTGNTISFEAANSTFTFVLPESASNIVVDRREVIIFRVPPSFQDKLINSPLVALIGVVLIPIAAAVYRRVKALRWKIKR